MSLNILLTGGASGVGAATVRQLLDRGHRLTSLDVKQAGNDGVDERLCDLSDPAAIDAAVAGLDGPYDALLNIAGVPGTVGADLTMQVNFFGLRHLTERLWDRLADGASIVNVASIAGNNWRKRRGYLGELLAITGFRGRLNLVARKQGPGWHRRLYLFQGSGRGLHDDAGRPRPRPRHRRQ